MIINHQPSTTRLAVAGFRLRGTAKRRYGAPTAGVARVNHSLCGQAMVEFAVALIVIMILLAGMIQIGILMNAHTETMITARKEAGEQAMIYTYSGSIKDRYIFDWTDGPDNKRYTRDDSPSISLNVSASAQYITDTAHPDELASFVPDNAFSTLDESFYPVNEFFLVHGHDSDSIPTFPVIRNLIYNRSTISTESDVWLAWTQGGIY